MNFERRSSTKHTDDDLSLLPSRNPTNVGSSPEPMHRRSPTRHLTFVQYTLLLGVIDEVGGVATLDEISRALPGVEQPVSAVFDLCDADILCGDWESAFDGDMRVWRVDR